MRQRPEPENLGLDDEDDDMRSLLSTVTSNTRATKQTRASGPVASSIHGGGTRSISKAQQFESAEEKNAIISVKDKEADDAGLVEHNGSYWVHK